MAAGAGLGGVLRFAISLTVSRTVDQDWLFLSTLTVNIFGSFIAGVVVAFVSALAPEWRVFLIPGLLGGFTTFSAFSLETMAMLQRGALAMAGFYVVASLLFCVGCAFLGVAAGQYWRTTAT